jgi:hypothetical protein
MSIANITQEHVMEALGRIDAEGVPASRNSRKFVLVHEEKAYPPKYVLGIAVEIATGHVLDPADYGGGEQTNAALTRLGFTISKKDGAAVPPARVSRRDSTSTARHSESCDLCKNAVVDLLRAVYGTFGVVGTERHRRLPLQLDGYDGKPVQAHLQAVLQALEGHRGHQEFVTRRWCSPCDVYVDPPGFILEFDEGQHFTLPRAVALRQYPKTLALGFDRAAWIERSEASPRRDNDPPHRDEARAWNDAIRDVAPAAGLANHPTVRLEMGAFPWCTLKATRPADVDKFKEMVPGLPAKNDEGMRVIRIARIVMDIGLRKADVAALAPDEPRPEWTGSFKAIRNRQAREPDSYAIRISRLASAAVARDADYVLFPACAFVYQSEAELACYLEACKDLPYVITGSFSLTTGEEALIIRHGEIIHRFETQRPVKMKLGDATVYAAISSTIGLVRSGETRSLDDTTQTPTSPVFIFDHGHNQYNGRYVKTLKSVQKFIARQDGTEPLFVLSFWHYAGATSGYWWYEPRASKNVSPKRHLVTTPEAGLEDWVDLLSVKTPEPA